jgi:hypothetical protein
MSDTQRRDIYPNMQYRIMFKVPILKQTKSAHVLATDILILSHRHGISVATLRLADPQHFAHPCHLQLWSHPACFHDPLRTR